MPGLGIPPPDKNNLFESVKRMQVAIDQLLGNVATRLGIASHTHRGAHSGGQLDHGLALTGLLDDDHTIYIKADGTRAFTGDQSMGGNQLTNVGTPSAGTDAANKDYVDGAGSSWIAWAAL